jgi:hypothetical protein
MVYIYSWRCSCFWQSVYHLSHAAPPNSRARVRVRVNLYHLPHAAPPNSRARVRVRVYLYHLPHAAPPNSRAFTRVPHTHTKLSKPGIAAAAVSAAVPVPVAAVG